ncbi:MAG: Lacal_2735 family protein [Saprospiraceae bacterium]|jgi:hypothetical protein|nr:Lacal_2735 family protein [Saprospiraceae bacterium]MBL0025106.1 Lacal_2735 family protein [Saprospiraceae bacterium]
MFGLFKKKSKNEILMIQYKKLMEEAFRLSKINRAESDSKIAEANELIEGIDQNKE